MAPPHLHPRSRTTSSLFATVVAVSFCVVALPHALPCPVPPRSVRADRMCTNKDAEGRPQQRRQRRQQKPAVQSLVDTKVVQFSANIAPAAAAVARENTAAADDDDDDDAAPRRRECPVPKPRGLLGQLLGFPGK